MDATNEVISSLKFIGKLKKGDKINTKFMYTQPDGIWTRIQRTFVNHDNRHNTLNFLQRTIYNAFEVINTLLKSIKISDQKMATNVIDDLKNAKVGLANIRETYSSDLKFNCDVSTLLQTIDTKLEDIELKFKLELKMNLSHLDTKTTKSDILPTTHLEYDLEDDLSNSSV